MKFNGKFVAAVLVLSLCATFSVMVAIMAQRVRCLLNLHTYIGYKVLEFTREQTLAGITIREKAGGETLKPAKGAFIAVGLAYPAIAGDATAA